MTNKILEGVAEYYNKKVLKYGNTALGVDWNSKESQYLRFEQLCKVIKPDVPFSLLDYGCGYAELINYLFSWTNAVPFKYIGFDISAEMINHAKGLFGRYENVFFYNKLPEIKIDYILSSGIFNVKLDLVSNNEWFEYIIQTLNNINQISERGFSFNALTKYSDKECLKEYLYYADPLMLFNYCKQHFSKNVALLHDYDLFEFTIIVRK